MHFVAPGIKQKNDFTAVKFDAKNKASNVIFYFVQTIACNDETIY